MKLEVRRFAIEIVPESEEDIAYIEEVLKLKSQGDSCECIRQNMLTTLSISYIEIRNKKEHENALV